MGSNPPPASDPAPRSATEGIGRYAAVIATIIGLFVTLNTAVTGCMKDRIDRSSSFRAAVKGEEGYWSGLYTQYLDAVGQPVENQRNAKLLAITMLATHQIPKFEEFSLGRFDGASEDERKTAYDQLQAMKRTLQDSLSNAQSSGDVAARNAAFIFANKTEQRDREENVVTAAAQEATQVQIAATADQGPAITYATRVLSAGSATGWDTDVFWCAGGDELARYQRASKLAAALAAAADAKQAIAPGVTLGRIRLRTLPHEQQGPDRFYVSGDAVIGDSGRGEAEAAAGVAALAGRNGLKMGTAKSIGPPTKWYLSAFICGGAPRQAPAATAAAG